MLIFSPVKKEIIFTSSYITHVKCLARKKTMYKKINANLAYLHEMIATDSITDHSSIYESRKQSATYYGIYS